MWSWVIGFGCSALVAYSAYKRNSLSSSGMLAAILMGTIFFAMGSPLWYGILLAFFVSSSVMSHVKKSAKETYEAAYEKSGRRDAGQVFANGGIGMLLCIAFAIHPDPIIVAAFVGVMATVTADTWATEIGSLSRSQPRSILTWRRIPTGTSGGVSALGTGAAMCGGLFIGVCAAALDWLSPIQQSVPIYLFLLMGWIGGTAGAFTDSIMGATCQVMYRCPKCGKMVERKDHCGVRTNRTRGLSWMNNDQVNWISSCAGGLVAIILLFVAGV
ncbi:DUF92 domain-containing protein [Paenibacillus guangzhouensis]|uniref:DUF92 domain-containing protein n=1 Tax=Paenibacillus guangzhouensis TaxID=1473112 RepID=UPI0012676F78|nr:DUF92 domain-containing protein [Paenibacillus guangzhouensis]